MALSLSRNLPGPRIFFLRRFLDLISKSVSSSRPAHRWSMRAEAVKIGRRTNLAACFALARPYLDGFEHDGTLNAVAMTIRGEPAFGTRFNRATTLYPVGPRTRTMMQSCASAAKLRGGGPILHSGIEAKETRRDPATSNPHRRPVTSGRTRPKLLDAFGDFR